MENIADLKARMILDSRGEWTVEATVGTKNGLVARASVPQGESRGSAEAVALPAAAAVHNIETIIRPALLGAAVSDQASIDQRLLALDGTSQKSKLGGNAMLAVSLACARAAALVGGHPLWQYLRQLSGLEALLETRPRLFALMVEGGLHAPGGVPFQEYMIIPHAATVREAVGIVRDIYSALRQVLIRRFGPSASRLGDEGAFGPPFADVIEPLGALREAAQSVGRVEQVDWGLDAAASNVAMNVQELTVIYQQLCREQRLMYLEDPFGEDDFENFARLGPTLAPAVWLTGDDLTVTNVGRMQRAHKEKSINAVVIKPNQIGTLTETLAAVRQAREYGWRLIVSHRGRETNDDFIADLAWGIGADGLKLGSPARGERVAKYNRLLEIEEEYGASHSRSGARR